VSDIEINESLRGITLAVKVTPRSSRNHIAGVRGGALKIQLQAPPVAGEANKALIAFLASILNIPRKDLKIIKGLHQQQKIVEINGVSKNKLLERIALLSDA